MMATTHVLAGVVIGLAAVAVGPVESGLVVLAAGLGGLAPDLDILGAHRKTLHFPVYGSVAAALAILLAALVPTLPTVALAAFLLAAAVHAVSSTPSATCSAAGCRCGRGTRPPTAGCTNTSAGGGTRRGG
jgi:hypothetical protein